MKLFLGRIFLIMVLILGCFGLVACSNNEQDNSSLVKQNQRPQGNMVMKDEAGNTVITIDDIQSAETISNNNNGTKEYCVSIKFTEKGTAKFATVTEKNIGKTLPIFVNDEMVSAPIIKVAITNGEAIITGYMQTYDECQKLVDLIYAPSESSNREE